MEKKKFLDYQFRRNWSIVWSELSLIQLWVNIDSWFVVLYQIERKKKSVIGANICKAINSVLNCMK